MQLNLLLGWARECPGSACTSPVWLARSHTLSPSLSFPGISHASRLGPGAGNREPGVDTATPARQTRGVWYTLRVYYNYIYIFFSQSG